MENSAEAWRAPGGPLKGTSKSENVLPGFEHLSKGLGPFPQATDGCYPVFKRDNNVHRFYQPSPPSATTPYYGSGLGWNLPEAYIDNLMAAFGYIMPMPSSNLHNNDHHTPSEGGDFDEMMAEAFATADAGPNPEEPEQGFRLLPEAAPFIPAVIYQQVQDEKTYAAAAAKAAAGEFDPTTVWRYMCPAWISTSQDSVSSDSVTDIDDETYYIGCLLREQDTLSWPLTTPQKVGFEPEASPKSRHNDEILQGRLQPDVIVHWREGDEPLIVTNPLDEMDDLMPTAKPVAYPTASSNMGFNNFSPFKHDMLWSIPTYPSSTGSYEMEPEFEYPNASPSPSSNSDNCGPGKCNCHSSVNGAGPSMGSNASSNDMSWASAAANEMWSKAKAANYQYLYAMAGRHNPVASANPNYFKRYIMCPLCKRNGQPACMYNSHALYNKDDIVTCPILRRYKCSLCGASGDNAHTLGYCPLNQK